MTHLLISVVLNVGLFTISDNVNINDITVKIENLKSDKGVLIVALFDSEENYLKQDYKSRTIRPKQAKKGVVFNDIPEGTYAASIIHDENENGELDKNWMGIPSESFGFSKKSLGMMGPPSFKETCFKVYDKNVSVTVKMKSL